MDLTFIVNGTETIVTTDESQKLQTAVDLALEQSGNTARHSSEFQIILDDATLDSEKLIQDYASILADDSVMFLSLKAGVGGSGVKTGIELIAQERKEQIEKHKWTKEHDSQHNGGELVHVAIAAMLNDYDFYPENWDYKLKDKIRNKSQVDRLKVAGACIAAEIDRIQS